MATTEVREIRVRVDTKGAPGLKEVANGFKNLNNSVKQSTSVLTSFRNVYLGLQGLNIAGFGLRELANSFDSIQKLTDRLTLSEGSAEGARIALTKLNEVAKSTNTGIEDLATIYSRLNLSLKDTGIGTDALLGLTQALQNSFRLSGSTAAEATAATIQLSQGLASGALRGQELRSVLEANALFGEILAKQLGITRGELIKFAEKEGGIKAIEVIKAVSNNFDDLNKRAEKLQPTISEGLSVAFNDFKLALGDLNKEFGITQKLVAGIQFTSKNLKEIAVGVTALGTAWFFYAKGAGLAVAANTALATFFASPVVGYIVKFGIAIAGLLATLNPVIVAVTALGAAFVAVGGYVANTFGYWDKLVSKVNEYKESIYNSSQASKTIAQQSAETLKLKLSNDKLAESQKTFSFQSNEAISNVTKLIGGTKEVQRSTSAYGAALKDFSNNAKFANQNAFDYKKSLAQINQEYLKTRDISKYNVELRKLKIADLTDDFKAGKIDIDKYNERLKEINFGKPRKSLDEFRLDLRALNADLNAGNLTIGEFAAEVEQANIDKLARDMKTGRASALDYNKALNAKQIGDWNRAIAEGTVGFYEFNTATRELQLDQLNQEFRAGTLDVYEYNEAVTRLSEKFEPGSAFFTGTAAYIQQAGTISQGIASAVTNTFKTLEDSFVEFTKNGKFNFTQFANSVLEDLNRIIIRSLIIRPLAQGILSAIPSGGGAASGSGVAANYSGPQNANLAARGAAFDGMATNFFATGGVVSGRTGFTYGGGHKGVMGEAGPEAILPLTRNKNGDLGVAASGNSGVIVNVINKGDATVEQKESQGPNGERVLDILIVQKVKEGFASGAFDKQMAQNYNLRRRGI